jgi:8-oxo-dGTP diphosphatase
VSQHFPRVGVSCLIHLNDGLVLIKRSKPPYQGLWSFPGGRVEFGETLQEAAKREVLEETGLSVSIISQIKTIDIIEPDFHYVLHVFEAQAENGILKAESDACNAAVFQVSDLKQEAVTPQVWEIIKMSLDERLMQDLEDDHHDLILRFVLLFSRFEYAMRRSEIFALHGCGRPYSCYKAGWDEWSRKLPDEFWKDFNGDELSRNPPQKFNPETNSWNDSTPSPSDNKSLFDAVKRLRNNLFHGDKTMFDEDRDVPLLKDAIKILNRAYEAASDLSDPKLKEFFRYFSD